MIREWATALLGMAEKASERASLFKPWREATVDRADEPSVAFTEEIGFYTPFIWPFFNRPSILPCLPRRAERTIFFALHASETLPMRLMSTLTIKLSQSKEEEEE